MLGSLGGFLWLRFVLTPSVSAHSLSSRVTASLVEGGAARGRQVRRCQAFSIAVTGLLLEIKVNIGTKTLCGVIKCEICPNVGFNVCDKRRREKQNISLEAKERNSVGTSFVTLTD